MDGKPDRTSFLSPGDAFGSAPKASFLEAAQSWGLLRRDDAKVKRLPVDSKVSGPASAPHPQDLDAAANVFALFPEDALSPSRKTSGA